MSRLLTPKHPPGSHAGAAAKRPLVIKLGGAAIDAADGNAALYAALADFHRLHPGGTVLVHGGGAAVDRHLERVGVVSQRRDGIRLTPAEHIDDVVAVLAGTVNKRLVGRLHVHGARAVGLCLSDGLLARTAKATGYDFDPGCVGQIDGGEPEVIHTLLAGGFMPVLCSIGLDAQGAALNVNADDAAADIAHLVDAAGLVFLTDVPGVLDPAGRMLAELRAAEIEGLIAAGHVTGGMIAKVRGAARAAARSGLPVTIASWKDPGALAGPAVTGTRILPCDAPLAGAVRACG